MPVSRKLHHSQFEETPPCRTRFVTRFGVSVLKVVATMEMPTSHHGAARPEVKNSLVFWPARRQKNSAGRKLMKMEAAMMPQSSEVKWKAVAAEAAAEPAAGRAWVADIWFSLYSPQGPLPRFPRQDITLRTGGRYAAMAKSLCGLQALGKTTRLQSQWPLFSAPPEPTSCP